MNIPLVNDIRTVSKFCFMAKPLTHNFTGQKRDGQTKETSKTQQTTTSNFFSRRFIEGPQHFSTTRTFLKSNHSDVQFRR